ncbi:Transcriptional regulator BolA [Fasciolopsis buskii]|uniref:Transcriptional regulator BolA n=1 Tax=Fasciolopsis buskii TaxID=27845 RepID=A0A8E0VGW9_9TREM|nr:Transcriptional regulator BolA [Fasciolopsis buski]
MNAEEVRSKLKTLDPVHLEVEDFSDGCGKKFRLLIVSDAFDGRPLLERHRMVNNALAEEMPHIHAITMKTLTPEQWKKIKSDQ